MRIVWRYSRESRNMAVNGKNFKRPFAFRAAGKVFDP